MDSRALVKKVINFEDAPRIGFNLPSPWPCDVVHAGLGTAPDLTRAAGPKETSSTGSTGGAAPGAASAEYPRERSSKVRETYSK